MIMQDGSQQKTELESQGSSPEDALRSNNVIMHMKFPGTGCHLSAMFDSETNKLNDDKVTTVYFRTASGNIYRLDNKGNLINANESKKQGKIASVLLSPIWMKNNMLEIGKSFTLGTLLFTTQISEILAVRQRGKSPQYQEQVLKIPIVRDFETVLSQIPQKI